MQPQANACIRWFPDAVSRRGFMAGEGRGPAALTGVKGREARTASCGLILSQEQRRQPVFCGSCRLKDAAFAPKNIGYERKEIFSDTKGSRCVGKDGQVMKEMKQSGSGNVRRKAGRTEKETFSSPTGEELSRILDALKRQYPDTACGLACQDDAWRLLIMARLSAQCTDKRVNEVAVSLFRKYPDMRAMAAAPLPELEEAVRSCGLYRTKARNLRDMCAMLLSDFDGKVPSDMEALLSLPGVGRKIANLIRGDIFGLPAVVTDTHCIRVAGRIGFYPETEKSPEKIEKLLSAVLPEKEQKDFCHRMVDLGREFCRAGKPLCESCPLCAAGACRRASAEAEKRTD